jgi:hypothetical protein
MGWKKFIIGEKMPDKDDPKYRKQYDEEVESGRKFAEKLHIDVPFKKAQQFANRFPSVFLAAVFGFVIICLCLNVYRMAQAYHARPDKAVTATERQEEKLRQLNDSMDLHNIKIEKDVSK